jgi:hypothetical protein
MLVGLVNDMARNALNKSTWMTVPVVIVGALGLLVSLLIGGRLNTQTFATSCLIVMVVGAIIWGALLRRSGRPVGVSGAVSSVGPRNVSKKKALQVTFLLLFLIAVFWMTRGEPWIPRLIGASMLILIITGVALRKTS